MSPLAVILAAQASTPVVVPPPAPPPITTVPVAPFPPGFTYPSSPRPLLNPGYWVTTDDYPVAAMRADEQGTTAFVLAIDQLGKVSKCEIAESSGSATLDAATCELITRRARFIPARDAAGKPTAGSYASRVRWVLPEPDPLEIPFVDEEGGFHVFSLTYRFFIEPDGTTSDCVLETETTVETLDQPEGPCAPGRPYKPFLDANGKPVRKRVSVTVRSAIEDSPGR